LRLAVSSVLRRRPGTVGPGDSLRGLGLSSLRALRVCGRVERESGVVLEPRLLLEHDTIDDVVRALADAGGLDEPAALAEPDRSGAARPLSGAEQRMWFLQSMDPATCQYVFAGSVLLRGELSAGALGAALGAVVARHEPLRTRYLVREDGGLVAEPSPPAPFPLPAVDLSGLDLAQARCRVSSAGTRQRQTPFPLADGKLLRAELLRLAADEHVLIFATHHIAFDGWSIPLLFAELDAAYRAVTAGADPSRAAGDLSAGYRDFARLRAEENPEDLAWWQDYLAGAPTDIAPPGDLLAGRAPAGPGAVSRFALTPELAAAVRRFSVEAGATGYVTLLTAFAVLVRRYSDSDDLLIGTLLANRARVAFQPLIGMFVNTVVVRQSARADAGFRELVASANKAVLGAFGQREVPFERLVEQLSPDRGVADGAPLFRVMFDFHAFPIDTGRIGPLRLSATDGGPLSVNEMEVAGSDAKFDLTLTMEERGDDLLGALEYRADLYSPPWVRQFTWHFQRLLAAAVADPGSPVGMIPLPGADSVLAGEETKDPAGTVSELISQVAERHPDRIAVRDAVGALRYSELARRSDLLARRLRERGIGTGDVVGLLTGRSAELIVALLGVSKAGAAYLPLDPRYPLARLAAMGRDAGAAALVAEPGRLGDAGAIMGAAPARVTEADGLAVAVMRPRPPRAERDRAGPGDAAYVLFTSGTTGRPKGVVVEHAALASAYHAWRRRYRLDAAGRHLQLAGQGFDVFTGDVVRALCSGGRLVIAPDEAVLDPSALYTLMRDENVDLAEFTPAVMQVLLDHLEATGGDLSFMRVVIVGSDVWLARDHRRLRRLVTPRALVVNSYGVTEATVDSAMYEGDADGRPGEAAVPVGRPLPGVRLQVLDRWLRPVPAGVPGELWVAGRGVARGYLARPELTAERFLPDPLGPPGSRMYRTGDRARLLRDGNLDLLGRTDRQLKVRGIRLEAEEVEAVLSACPGVRRAVVAMRDGGLIAYLVPAPDTRIDVSQVRAAASRSLPAAACPTRWAVLATLPLTPNGKVDLAALDSAAVEARSQDRRPAGELEREVADVFADVLGVREADADRSFFELGGHSLMLTRLGAAIGGRFGVRLTVRELFEHNTPAAVTRLLAAERATSDKPLTRAGNDRAAPASEAQRRLWLLEQIEPDRSGYAIPVLARVGGRLDATVLRQALANAARRHEALRTGLSAADGDLRQRVLAPGAVRIPLRELDLRGEPAQALRRRLAEESTAAFDLAVAPLARACLVTVADTEQVLCFTVHHAVCDGVSLGILLSEVFTDYARLAAGEPAQAAQPTVDFTDWVRWRDRERDIDGLARQARRWARRLAGAPDLLALPTDRERPRTIGSAGRVHRFGIGAAATARLRELSKAEGVSLFTTLVSAVAVVLGRYSAQTDLCVGTPVSERSRPELDGMVGLLINTVVLRFDLDADPTFRGLLGRARTVVGEAVADAAVPFEDVVNAVAPARHPGITPLFQVLFTLEQDVRRRWELPGARVTTEVSPYRSARTDLSFSLEESEGVIDGDIEYRTDLFDADRIERLAGHYRVVLDAVTEDPGRRLSELRLLTVAELAAVREWNTTARAFPADEGAAALFGEQARRRPGAPAVYSAAGVLSYAGLDRAADALARRLRQAGAGPDIVVAACLPPSSELVIALLAVLKAGSAYLAIEPGLPAQRRAFMLRDAGARLLITRPGIVKDPGVPTVTPDADERVPAGVTLPRAGGERLAYVLYTSGSSGQPKGVAVPHRALARLTRGAEFCEFGPGRTQLQLSPMSFDGSVLELWGPLLNGGAVAIPDPGLSYLERLRDGLRRYPVTTLLVISPQLALVLDEPRELLDGVRELLVGGDVLPPTLADRAVRRYRHCRVRHLYGPTECTVVATERTLTQVDTTRPSVPIGRPIGNTTAYVLDARRRLQPVGVPGELYLGGPGVALGYLGLPELTRDHFVPDEFAPGGTLYRTGDLARWLPGGELEFLGRADNQVKIRGYRIELSEVEAALAGHPSVAEAAAVVKEGPASGRGIVGYVVLTRRGAIALDVLRKDIGGRLPEYMLPTAIVELDAFPLTPHGKLDRAALPAPALPEAARPGQPPPSSPTERAVAACWREVLGVAAVGLLDNFFVTCGGDSLRLMRLYQRLERAWPGVLRLAELFDLSTVAAQAEVIDERTGASSGPTPATPSFEL
jgi:amino acid adenylation domain-containing protein